MTLDELKTQVETEIATVQEQISNLSRVQEEMNSALQKKTEALQVIESAIASAAQAQA